MGWFDILGSSRAPKTYRPSYKNVADEQLLQLWNERDSMTEIARTELMNELGLRGLSVPTEPEADREESFGPRRSFFALAFHYDFDGARESAELFCYAQPDHIRSCIRQVIEMPAVGDTLDSFSTDPRTGGRARAVLFRVEDGRAVAALALDELARVLIGPEEQPLRDNRERQDIERLVASGARLDMDWSPIDEFLAMIPPGTPLQRGDTSLLEIPAEWRLKLGQLLEPLEEVQFGFEDLAYGPDVARSFVDPAG